MDVQLREREEDTVLGKLFADALVQPVGYFLVVRREHPDPQFNLDGTVLERVHVHFRFLGAGCGLVHDFRLPLDQLEQDLPDLVDIRVVRDAEFQAQAMGVPAAVIVDGPVGERPVGDGDLPVVRRHNLRMDDVDLGDPAENALRIDEVPDFEGLERQEDQPACEILHGAAHGHADGHAAGRQQGGDGRRVDAQRAHHGQDEDNPQQRRYHALDERGDRRVRPLLGESLGDELFGLPDQPRADDVDRDGEEEFESEFGDRGQRPFQQFIGGRRLDGFHELRPFRDQRVGRQLIRDRNGLKKRYEHISHSNLKQCYFSSTGRTEKPR